MCIFCSSCCRVGAARIFAVQERLYKILGFLLYGMAVCLDMKPSAQYILYLHDLPHVSWVGHVLLMYRSTTTSHNGRLDLDDLSIDDISVDHPSVRRVKL